MLYKFSISGVDYELDTNSMLMSECVDIEKVTGTTYTKWEAAIGEGSMTALKAGLWIAVRRKQPDLKFSEFDFSWGDFEVAQDEAEDPTTPPEPSDSEN